MPTPGDTTVKQNNKNPCAQKLTLWCRKIDNKQNK